MVKWKKLSNAENGTGMDKQLTSKRTNSKVFFDMYMLYMQVGHIGGTLQYIYVPLLSVCSYC